jgi:rubrerythrin
MEHDAIDDMQQPRCPVDGVLMRDAASGWVCPACDHREPQEEVTLPTSDVPGIHGG